MKPTVHLWQKWHWLAAVVLGATTAQTQTLAPTQPGSATRRAAEDETITLSPFVVSTEQDTGYIAADTINAGRLRTNLLMTPGDMEVFTRDLLDDLGVFSSSEASGWLTSSHPLELGGINGNSLSPSSLALHDSGSTVTLRGVATQPSTRNYFLSATTPMEYNVQRIESGRGPNAILYGEGGPGGGVNYITKKAEHRAFGSIRLRADTLWSKGLALDINRPITSNLDVRYNAAVMEQRSYVARVRYENFGNALSAAWRPWERTRVNVEVDFTKSQRPGFIMTSYTDQYSDWNKVPVTGTLTSSQATAAGLALRSYSNVYVEGLGMIDLRNTAYTTGTGIPLISVYPAGVVSEPPPDKSFNVQPSQINVRADTVDLQATIDHSFRNGLSLQLGGQYAKYDAAGGTNAFISAIKDPNVYLPGGRPNPNFGKVYSYTNYGRHIDGTNRESKTTRLVAAYPIKALGGTTSLSAFAHHQESNSRTVYWDDHIVDPTSTLPITNNASLIYLYRYWDKITPSLPDFSKMFTLREVPTADGITGSKNDAYEVAASGEYLGGRLTYVAGFRRDRSDLSTRNGDTATRDRVTGAFGDYTVENRVAYNNTQTFGVVYFPWERIGAYADYAEGFTIQTNANPRLDGTFAKANIVPSKAESVGLRFRLARTSRLTIVGSAGFYQAEQNNSAVSIVVGPINTLWSNHGMPQRYIETFSASATTTSSLNAIQSTRSFSGKGYEGSLTVNVANQFRLIGNVAFPQTRQFNTAADYRAYVAANMPQWQQWANDPTNRNRTSDLDMLRSINVTVTGFQDERVQNGTYKYRWNMTGVYTVPRHTLRGLRLGGGIQYFGPRVIYNEIERPYDYVYAKSYYLLSGSLGYPVKLARHRVDVQLNVNNLLNYDTPMNNGMMANQGRLIPYGFRRMDPREVRLTSTLSF